MNPELELKQENDGVLEFTLSNIHVSFANAIRRVIISEIPVCAIDTPAEMNITHDTQQTNEIIKHQLSCIPVHFKVPMKKNVDEQDVPLIKDFQLEINEENKSDQKLIVTTEHIKIKNMASGNYLTKEEVRNIFPADILTNEFIGILSLRPGYTERIQGESIKLETTFSIKIPKNEENGGVYSSASIATFYNNPEPLKIQEKWEIEENKLKTNNVSRQDINFLKKDFLILDSQKIFKKNSFVFKIESIGVYENDELVKFACFVLIEKISFFETLNDNKELKILNSEVSTPNTVDIILENEDYTLGLMLQYVFFEKYFPKALSYCGFTKQHPHDDFSIIRLSFHERIDDDIVRQYIKTVCEDAKEVFQIIMNMF